MRATQHHPLILAIPTHDGRHISLTHFGDGAQFQIHHITPEGSHLAETLENPSASIDQEHDHGEASKAHGLAGLFRQHGVTALLAGIFGPNIRHMSKAFLCILSSREAIVDALDELRQHKPFPQAALEQEPLTGILRLPSQGERS